MYTDETRWVDNFYPISYNTLPTTLDLSSESSFLLVSNIPYVALLFDAYFSKHNSKLIWCHNEAVVSNIKSTSTLTTMCVKDEANFEEFLLGLKQNLSHLKSIKGMFYVWQEHECSGIIYLLM